MFSKFRQSLTTRLLLLFILISLLTVALLIGSIVHAVSSQWRYAIAPHIEQYLDYVNADLDYPPSQQRAIELAEKLPLNIYIEGPDISFSSSGKSLDIKDLEFRDRKTSKRRRHQNARIDVGEHNDRTVLRNKNGEYSVYYEMQHRRSHNRRKGPLWVSIIILGLMLGVCYLVLRKMLRPVQDIKQAVQLMGAGQLDTRIPVRSENDLGSLAVSINTMATDIELLLDAKRQLLLGASHELRTPITRAKIAAQMLENSENQTRIIDDLDEMESLIEDIIESERVTGGHSALNTTNVDLKDLLSTVLSDFKDSRIACNFTDNLPSIKADTTRLRLLFKNLINNALEHGAKEPPPELTVKQNSNSIFVTITDYGKGISKQHLQRLTEPFYRTDASRARSTGGFGLGLHIVDLIVIAHGGKLSIDSNTVAQGNKSTGTSVTVELPLRQ